MGSSVPTARYEEVAAIDTASGQITGSLVIPQDAKGAVIFAHGSGSGRLSPRNQFVADSLQQAGLATLLIDLLTAEEEVRDRRTTEHRFDIHLLADRLSTATDWMINTYQQHEFRFGYFGASTGAAAALVAAASREDIAAIVSRGGRPDLAGEALPQVRAATLLIVGSRDSVVIDLNDEAFKQLTAAWDKKIHIVPGASHLFEEPGTLEQVARLAGEWFVEHLDGDTTIG